MAEKERSKAASMGALWAWMGRRGGMEESEQVVSVKDSLGARRNCSPGWKVVSVKAEGSPTVKQRG